MARVEETFAAGESRRIAELRPEHIYQREMAARVGHAVLGIDAATGLFRAIFRRARAPMNWDGAYVQRGTEPGIAKLGWDWGTIPPIPFIHAGPGTPDVITVIHEAAHALINMGRMPTSWEEAHSPAWETLFLDLLDFWAPEAANILRKAPRAAETRVFHPPIWRNYLLLTAPL